MMFESKSCFKSGLRSHQFMLFLHYSRGSSQKHSSQLLLSDAGETRDAVNDNIEVTENVSESIYCHSIYF